MRKNIIKIFPIVSVLVLTFSINIYAKNVIHDTYNVQKGDSLWRISEKYGIELDKVIDSNPQFLDPDLIYPNDKVTVPTGGENDANKKIGASMIDSGNGSIIQKPNINFGENIGQTVDTENLSFEKQVFEIVNRERSKQGLAPLKLSDDISNVARVKSQDMRDNRYFDHQSARYGSPFDMLKEFGINYRTAGENIAKGQRTPQAVMTAWMNSEGHRKNIMNPNYKELGVGYVTDNSGTTYWTQMFVTR